MTNLRVPGVLVAADTTSRTITYRLLPYGAPGRTSLGLVTASRGAVTIPDPTAVTLNMEHDPTRPVGRLLSTDDRDDALHATFRIAQTSVGDDLLAEVSEGLRTGASVELDGVLIRDGQLVAGALTGAGAVTRPAFADARALLVASDTDPDDQAPDATDPDTAAVPDPDPDTAAVPDEREDTPVTVTDPTLTAAAPSALPPVTTAPAARDLPLSAVNRLLASVSAGDRDPQLLAALSDLTYTANAHVLPPQFIQEVWSGNPYQRQIVPLIGTDTLTSPKVQGWRWKVAPAGADYTGDKTDVPSNAALTEAVEWDAARWAGAHDHDRIFVDFGVEGYWSSYWSAMAASYAQWSDGKALTGIKTAATDVAPAAGESVVASVIRCALSVIPHGTPTFALLGASAFAAMAETDPLAFLTGQLSIPSADGNVGGLRFASHANLAAGDVIVGTRNAATWYELGGTPIRVNTVDLVKGGEDTGAFGYGVLGTHAAVGLAKTTWTAPTP
jgi:hypothetical protein